MPAFLCGSFAFWGIVAAWGWLEQGQSSVAAGSSPIPEGSTGSLLSPLRSDSRRCLIATGVMMQRGDGEGSCSGCERFASISQGKRTTGLAQELDWFLLSPWLFSPLQRAAPFLGAVRAWAQEGWGLAQPTSCLQLLRQRYYSSVFRCTSGPIWLVLLAGVMERLLSPAQGHPR